MRYWRLLFVSFLLTLSIAGCRRKPVRALAPQHAQPPIISTLPSLPPLTLRSVQLQQPKPAPPASPSPAATPPAKKRVKNVRHRRATSKEETETTTSEPKPSASGNTSPVNTTPAPPAAALIGKLSAEDSTATPTNAAETKHLIDSTEAEVNKIPAQQRMEHKDAIAQVNSFLAQARQALSMNDVVGAQTLANKAKILVDELSK